MRIGFTALTLALLGTGAAVMAQSPYESAADFAKYARKLREQALLKVEPQVFVPTASRTSTTTRYPWKTNIVTTVFWIGEQAGGNNPVPNHKSSWDANWASNYGGFDNPDSSSRRNYIPAAFVPRQNPFYCALPYNDVTHGQFKPEAALVIPWFKQAYTGTGQSVRSEEHTSELQSHVNLVCRLLLEKKKKKKKKNITTITKSIRTRE